MPKLVPRNTELVMGEIYRFPQDATSDSPKIDNTPNFYHISRVDNFGFSFQKGIHKVKAINPESNEPKRHPLIIISSTPRKTGSVDTPWKNHYNPNYGYVKYYGDNKSNTSDPSTSPGNAILLELLAASTADKKSREDSAIPVIFFERCSYNNKPKGYAIFHGFGVLESATLVTQSGPNGFFTNYLFTFSVLSLQNEKERFNWNWIADRCDITKKNCDTLDYAPYSWKEWLKKGNSELYKLRRNISGNNIVKTKDQLPIPGSDKYSLLSDIYNFYATRKHDFEYLAMEVSTKYIESNLGANCCTPGWITKKSGDGGIDYVLRIDIGKDPLASVNMVVLGQAKCTSINSVTSGTDIARTVARLQRGWLGIYVTTSYFSEHVQKEIQEDKYPIMLINGSLLTDIVHTQMNLTGLSLTDYLNSLSTKYISLPLKPEDILDK